MPRIKSNASDRTLSLAVFRSRDTFAPLARSYVFAVAIPPDTHQLEYSNRLPATKLSSMLAEDLAHGNGTIRLRQVHAHAHRHATKVSLLRIREGVSTTLISLDHYCGYGSCQHFHDLPDAPEIRHGDALEFRCVYALTLPRLLPLPCCHPCPSHAATHAPHMSSCLVSTLPALT